MNNVILGSFLRSVIIRCASITTSLIVCLAFVSIPITLSLAVLFSCVSLPFVSSIAMLTPTVDDSIWFVIKID
ncbi:hypothetical protein BDB01DRAFT_170395 [Pilobolus umbonatus]|nr:hypothetical protein BDB01DRAFT_170395 [Pilobolus umbonatus]